MRAVRLDEIRKAAGAADAGDGGDFLVPELALFDQLEIKREHGEIAAAGAPGRMVGGDFFFGQALAFGVGTARGVTAVMLPRAGGNFSDGCTHGSNFVNGLGNYSLRRPAATLALARSRISFTFQVRPSVLLMPRIFGSQ